MERNISGNVSLCETEQREKFVFLDVVSFLRIKSATSSRTSE